MWGTSRFPPTGRHAEGAVARGQKWLVVGLQRSHPGIGALQSGDQVGIVGAVIVLRQGSAPQYHATSTRGCASACHGHYDSGLPPSKMNLRSVPSAADLLSGLRHLGMGRGNHMPAAGC